MLFWFKLLRHFVVIMPSDKKRSKGRAKKRRCCGNQFVEAKKAKVIEAESCDTDLSDEGDVVGSKEDSLLTEEMNIHIHIHIHTGDFAKDFLRRRDTMRITNPQRQTKSASLEERRARRQQRLTHNDTCAAREGQPYLARGH